MPLAFLPPILPPSKRAQDLVLDTQPAASGSDRRQYAGVARYVHRGDRRWTPQLPYARQSALRNGSRSGPGRAVGFLCVAQNLGLGEEAVGAIAARAEPGDEEEGATGGWGLFDAINAPAVAERLFYEAETWLFENTPGLARLAGPAAMEPLTPGGLLVDGFDAWPAALLPYNPPYYPELVESEGYARAGGWSAWRLACPAAETSERRAGPPDWRTLAQLADSASFSNSAAPGLRAWLGHLAGESPFPAHPHTRWALAAAFRRAVIAAHDGAAWIGIPDFASALRLVRGRLFPLGYAVFLLALARTRTLRVFPALAPPSLTAGALASLGRALVDEAGRRGYREMVIAPTSDEDEKNAEALAGLGARITQRFAVYEKNL